MDEEQLVKRLQTAVPSCLRQFKTTPADLPEPFDDNPCSVWLIACTCGGEQGRFLGYPLSSYNTEYKGPQCFLSPLAFDCIACNTVTELLETDRHGYHAEVARLESGKHGSTKFRGNGRSCNVVSVN